MRDETTFPARTWRMPVRGPLLVAGTILGLLGMMRRIRAKRRAGTPRVGPVSDEWLANHIAHSRDGDSQY